MKKLFTLIVAICATTLAWADASGSCGNATYTYVSSTGTLTISGTGDMKDFTSSSKVPWNAYSSSIKKVVINNGVTSVGDKAFYGCTGLTSVTIPNSVTSIGDEAFSGCSKLTSVEIPNSVTSIGSWAFVNCTGLTSITIGNDVTSIGHLAFYGCTGLTSVTIPNSVTSIDDNAFNCCTGLTSINVAEDNLNYASIDGVLYSKDKKTLIICPEGKTGSVNIPNSVTSIGDFVFYECSKLTSVTIPNSVTSIGYQAFKYCEGLTSVTIGNGVEIVGKEAFYGCTGLTSITVEATNPPLCVNEYGDGLYMPDYNIPLYVPAGSVDAYKTATEWKKFTNIQAIPGTGVNEATVENTVEKSVVKKIIDRNGIIYIEKDGTRYFLNGSKVK